MLCMLASIYCAGEVRKMGYTDCFCLKKRAFASTVKRLVGRDRPTSFVRVVTVASSVTVARAKPAVRSTRRAFALTSAWHCRLLVRNHKLLPAHLPSEISLTVTWCVACLNRERQAPIFRPTFRITRPGVNVAERSEPAGLFRLAFIRLLAVLQSSAK